MSFKRRVQLSLSLTDAVVYEVLADLALEVLGQRERALDPAVAVDDWLGDADALVHHALDRRPRTVDVLVRRHQNHADQQDRNRVLKLGR